MPAILRLEPGPVLSRQTFLRVAPAALLIAFAAGALGVTVEQRTWDSLRYSTWPSGYEAGRVARNLSIGLGYESPFLALPGDNFLTDDADDPGLAHPEPQEPRPGTAPTAWVTPPYVLLWLLAFSLFGVYTPAAVLAFQAEQVALMTLALWLGWRLLFRLRGGTTALLALAMLVLYPSSWYFAVHDTHGTALFVVWLLASLFALERIVAGARGPWIALHAASAALAVLTEPVCLFFYLWLELWAGFRLLRPDAQGSRRGVRLLAATAAAFALIVGPWFLRNLVVLRAPVPLRSNLPMELFYGNNPESAEDLDRGHRHHFPTWNDEERLRLLAVGEIEYGRQCLLRTAMFLHERPSAVLTLTAQRFTYFWSYNPFRVSTWRPFLTLLFHLPLGVLLAAWLLRPSGQDWFDRACLGFFLLFPLTYYVTHLMIYRYRFSLEAMVMLAAASAWGKLAGWEEAPVRSAAARGTCASSARAERVRPPGGTAVHSKPAATP